MLTDVIHSQPHCAEEKAGAQRRESHWPSHTASEQGYRICGLRLPSGATQPAGGPQVWTLAVVNAPVVKPVLPMVIFHPSFPSAVSPHWGRVIRYYFHFVDETESQ